MASSPPTAENVSDDDALVFGDDDAVVGDTRGDGGPYTASPEPAPWKVLVVDDDEGLHAVTRMVLEGARFEGRALALRSAYSRREALAALEAQPDTALVLLDVVMDTDDAGLLVAQALRDHLGNHDTRVVLRTGQPGLAPPREIVLRYAIDGYEPKAELTAQKLYTVVIAALRSYARASARTRALEDANHALARQAAALEAEVAARTEALSRALTTAQDALAAKETFLAVVSHELRTPLHGVLGAATLLADSRLDPAQRRHLDTLRASGQLLGAVIEDVLDLAQMTHEGLRLTPAPHVLRPIVEAAVQILADRAAAKGLALTLAIAPDVPERARVDATRLQQVLVNLLANGVKFTESGRVALAVSVRGGEGRTALRMTVTDTGIGVAPEAAAKLFEPFVQADASIRRTYGGTGLGLSICKRIVGAMGGTIGLESRLGEGTCVAVVVPLEVERATEATAPPTVPRDTLTPQRPSAPPDVAGRSALVVDDNSINAMLLRALLERHGLVVDEALDGVEAVAQLRTRTFDLVFMDMQMPRMDGPTATRHIRAECAARGDAQPFVVAVTANARDVDRTRCLEAGMDAFLSKPFTEDDLRAALAASVAPAPNPST